MEDIDDLRITRSSSGSTDKAPALAHLTSLILESAAEGIYGIDATGATTFVNPAAARMLGWESVELIGRPMHPTLHHSRANGTPYPQDECPVYATLRDGSVHKVSGEHYWRKDGTSFPVDYTSTPIWDAGQLSGAVVTFSDISERVQSESLRVLSHFLKTLPMGVFVVDNSGTPEYANDCAIDLLGVGVIETASTETLAHVYKAFRTGTDDEYPTEELPIVQALQGGTVRVEDIEIRRDGKVIPLEAWAQPIRGDDGTITHAIAVFRDISERKQLERELAQRIEELEHLALEDEATGLPNLRSFLLVVEQQLLAIGRSQMPATLGIFELRGLTPTAELYGREQVFRWLAAFGKAVRENINQPDFAARLDLDRFAIFVFGDEGYADDLLGRICAIVDTARDNGRWPSELELCLGRASYNPNRPWTPEEFIEAAAPPKSKE